MTLLTAEKLSAALGCPIKRAQKWAKPLSEAMEAYEINTPERIAAFLAQIGHESGRLIYVKELWGPTPAQSRYEGRADLGNTQPGDGKRFRGHGLMQTTGRGNHARTRDRLRAKFPDKEVPDFEANPEALTLTEWSAMSAADFWDERDLNKWADAGDFERITRIINGGTNGRAERLALWHQAKEALA